MSPSFPGEGIYTVLQWCKMLGVTFLHPLMSQHSHPTLCLSTLNENSTCKTSDRDMWGQRQAEGGGECITMDAHVQGYNHTCSVTLCWLVFLCRPHKPESVCEVSKQGLMSEEEAVTHCLLTSERMLLWIVLCYQLSFPSTGAAGRC